MTTIHCIIFQGVDAPTLVQSINVNFEKETDMKPSRTIETQCTHAEFMASLPKACGNRPYEIIDNKVIVHDGKRQIRIEVHDEPIRHLGSLELPMERARFDFDGYNEKEADTFMSAYRVHSFRAGGG